MTHDDDTSPSAPTPATRPSSSLTPTEMEAVVRRAVEIQTRVGGEGDVSETDMVQIGGELGLDAATVRRAMIEVQNRPDEGNALMRAMGLRFPGGQRVIRRPAEVTATEIEEYLRDHEHMIPDRRIGSRVQYGRDSSFSAFIGRITGRFRRPHRPLDVERLDVTVASLDGEDTLVEVTADMRGVRLGLTIAALAVGLPLAAIVFLVNSITSPWFLLGFALLGGPWLFFRAIYGTVQRQTRERVESLLDRIADDELD